MKYLYKIKLVVVLMLVVMPIYENSNAQVRSIIGAAVDITTPPGPSGFCNGAFNLVYDGTDTIPLAVADAGGFVKFKAAPLENSTDGVGYGVAFGGVGDILTLITFNIAVFPAPVTASSVISAGGVPDGAPDSGQIPVYDTAKVGANGFIVLGRNVGAPCGGDCVHIRGFTGIANGVNVIDTGASINGGVSLAHVIPGDSYWAVYVTGAGPVITKYSSGYTNLASVPAFGAGNTYIGLTSDDSFVYALTLVGGTYGIRKINRSTLTFVDTSYGATVKSSIIHVNGFLYVGESGTLVKINASTMAVVSTMLLVVGEVPLQNNDGFDVTNDRFYMVSDGGGTGTTIRRINLNTFVSEQSIGFAIPVRSDSVGFDFQHKRLWISSRTGSGVGNSMLLSRASVCP